MKYPIRAIAVVEISMNVAAALMAGVGVRVRSCRS
jgi:hypothetical protein